MTAGSGGPPPGRSRPCRRQGRERRLSHLPLTRRGHHEIGDWSTCGATEAERGRGELSETDRHICTAEAIRSMTHGTSVSSVSPPPVDVPFVVRAPIWPRDLTPRRWVGIPEPGVPPPRT